MVSEERVIAHALFQFVDPGTGQRRTAYRGDTVSVGEPDLSFGERFGAFVTDDQPTAVGVLVDELGSSFGEAATPVVLARPKRTAPKSAWLEFRGVPDAEEEFTLEQLQDDDAWSES